MSDYSIEVLSERAAEVKEGLARVVAEEDQLAEREAKLREELERLSAERRSLTDVVRERKALLTGLADDIARLQETKPVAAPDPGKVPERKDARTRTPLPDLDRGLRERHEVELGAVKLGRSRDPLRVLPQEHLNPKGAPGSKKPRKYLHPEPVDLDEVTSTWWERAELAYEVLQEVGGPLSQREWGETLSELLECKATTGASILSRCIGILQTLKRVLWTGDHDGRSALWVTEENATAELRAAAGLGTAEENFAGKTTRWPTPSTSPPKGSLIREEQGSFEGGKKR